MVVEICANSYQSAINAEKAGAHRIELCSELAVGGITPSYGLLKKVMSELSIPVHVLIRPRGGDFTYSDDEFEIMKQNILLCKELGCAGIVSGVLHPNASIDLVRTQELVELSHPMSFTFHRAFDWISNPKDAISDLEKIGVHRVLTSGQKTSAEKGISLLRELKDLSPVKILPGGGIKVHNIQMFKEAGFNEVHFSASTQIQTIATPKISMNSPSFFDETTITFSDIDTIKNILSKIHE
ncbi:copper homeostasis protein CutC [Pseudotenacibaculum haliotis]|uniref:PF03932 family protein CutC n=1 Tax=Pseudotenacibaculum haliotis TaxID=1862138 RepID=A0ABW5LMA4_9FLAO